MRFASVAIVLGFLASGLAFRPAFAATATASFGVSVTVVSSCDASAPASAFGNHPIWGGSPVLITCNLPTAYNVSFSTELAASSARKATVSAKALNGRILSSSSTRLYSAGQILGRGIPARAQDDSSDQLTAFSQSAWTRDVASGAFADAVTVTITY
jgi:spore coat protein U-like protein